MFHIAPLAKFSFFILLCFGAVSSTQHAGSAQLRPNQLEKGHERQYPNVFKGLFRSSNIATIIFDIPCILIQTLENDVDQSRTFVEQLQKGETPSLITQSAEQIPAEVVEAFRNVIGIYETLPLEIVVEAERAVSAAILIFDHIGNGAIVDDLKKLPGVVVSDVTSAWGDLTSGLEKEWGALTHVIGCKFKFTDCGHTTTTNAYTCNDLDATTTSAGAAPANSAEIRPESTTRPESPTRPESTPTVQLGNPTRTAALVQTSLITPFPNPTRPSTVSTRFPALSASATPSTVTAGLGVQQMIAPPRIFQLCLVFAVAVFGVALLL